MQTNLADFIRDTAEGQEADAILRKCVHCGFCTATCPTFVLLGDERDSPRGRIYFMKAMLEGDRAPTAQELKDCLFAWTVARHVKSNAIVYAKDGATAGIGAGQMNRLESARIAAWKAKDAADKAARSVESVTTMNFQGCSPRDEGVSTRLFSKSAQVPTSMRRVASNCFTA